MSIGEGKKIILAHLDLGIGGAEQLVVQVAKVLKESGHMVRILTTHHDVNHCFEETTPAGYLGRYVEVYGDWLPRKIFGRFHAFFAIMRMLYLAFVIVWLYRDWADVVVLDGVSAPIPILKYFGGLKILFYCHFPDLLLCTDRSNPFKKMYRIVVDGIEEYTTGLSDMILVNSKFTASIVGDTFPRVAKNHNIQILYPSVKPLQQECLLSKEESIRIAPYCAHYDHIFVSLNRFERKKRIEVAIDAMHFYNHNSILSKPKKVVLIIAGGYDKHVTENVQYLEELQLFCKQYSLKSLYLPQSENQSLANKRNETSFDVIFRTSISSKERTALFTIATGLLYTPDREHFGIVPLEAMQLGLPVIAVNSGGPMETIKHKLTGYLCSQTGEEFASCMLDLTSDENSRERMRSEGKKWVNEMFSEQQMKHNLNCYVNEVAI